jgi:hypothetical protein
MKKILIMAIFALLIVGCADSEPTFTSSGEKGYSIDCSGGDSSWGDCYEEAGEVCGTRGYRILEKMGDKKSSIFVDKNSLSSRSTNNRNLIIQCK